MMSESSCARQGPVSEVVVEEKSFLLLSAAFWQLAFSVSLHRSVCLV